MPAAPSPWRLGGLNARQLLTQVWAAAWVDDIVDRAAALAYYFLFSIFPILLFLTALVQLVPVRHVIGQLMDTAAMVLPPQAASLVRATLHQIVTNAGRPGLVSLVALTAIWVGSTGTASVMTMLNVVYRVRDERPWWRRRAIAVLLTLAFSVFLIVSMLLLMLSAHIGTMLARLAARGSGLEHVASMMTLALSVVLVLVAIELAYYLAPARARWHWLTPGSLTAATLWLAVSLGLRLYVSSIANYDVMYGSIGGIIVLLLWLYLTSLVLLLGAEINAVIEEAVQRQGAAPSRQAGVRAA
jgi:membrane protein